jgi:hypothetical protein
LGKKFAHYENWGLSGAGNHLIFYSLIECIERNKINKNDTIIIMWSGYDREDRYINGAWSPRGGLANQNFYDKHFLTTYYDTRGHQLRDLLIIKATKELLDSRGFNYKFLSMIPFSNNLSTEFDLDLIEFFDNIIASIQTPSAFELLYNNTWYCTKSTAKFGKTINKVAQREILEAQYPIFAGADWPSLEDFLNDKIEDRFREEMNKFNLFRLRDYDIREDNHPIPVEHLSYLKAIWPDIVISEEIQKWIYDYKLFDQFDSHRPKNRL